MTVQTTTRSQTYAGGQSALTFTFRTLVSNPNYILVNVISGGTTTPLVYNVGYTVSVNSSGVGGTVTVSPTYSTAYTYVVYRQTGVTQNSAYSDYNVFPASTVENNLDQLTMINQENSDNANRAITLPIGSSPSISTVLPLPVANYVLTWDPTATFLQSLAGTVGPIGPVGPSGSSLTISSSTTDITIVTTSTTATITSVNAATSGTSKIIKTGSDGYLHTYFPYMKFSNTQIQNTAGGTATSGSWLNIPLNTEDIDTANIASLSSSTISIPAGTYQVYGTNCFVETTNSQIRLFNVSDAAVILNGTSIQAIGTSLQSISSEVFGVFSISTTKIIAFQYQVGVTVSTFGLGNLANFGNEVYAQIELVKIA